MKYKTSKKSFILIPILLILILNAIVLIQYREVIVISSLLGFGLAFMSYSTSLIMDKAQNQFLIINSYFDGLFTEQIKFLNLDKYKSCTVSQRKASRNKNDNLTDEPTQYINEFYLRIFTENGIIEPFRGNSKKEQIKMFENKINEFFHFNENKLILSEDNMKIVRMIGYSLIAFTTIFGLIKTILLLF